MVTNTTSEHSATHTSARANTRNAEHGKRQDERRIIDRMHHMRTPNGQARSIADKEQRKRRRPGRKGGTDSAARRRSTRRRMTSAGRRKKGER